MKLIRLQEIVMGIHLQHYLKFRPRANESFHDNYLELDYDLSKVMFIATANNLASIQPALRDRMEIIEINGYTTKKKFKLQKNIFYQNS